MSKIGRNMPCPCGSGKKYKHCCMLKNVAYQVQLLEQRDTLVNAVKWLRKRYGQAVYKALKDNFFRDPQGTLQEKLTDLPEHLELMLHVCQLEWLIADAHLEVGRRWVRASELLLGPDGPKLSPHGRQYMEDMAASALSMYEILEVHPGKGVLLRDILRVDEAPLFVHEVQGSGSLVRWDILGFRIMKQGDKYTLGGGAYHLDRTRALPMAEALAKEIKRTAKLKSHVERVKALISACIVAAWLYDITTPPPEPLFVDAQTQEPIVFTTDSYRVLDWQVLEGLFESQVDVDWEDEDKWAWFEVVNEERIRIRAHFARLSSGVLEVECRTIGRADAARQWLENLAGPHLAHLNRTSEDSRDLVKEHAKSRSVSVKKPVKKQDNPVPLEVQQAVLTKYMTEHYEQWPNMPLPALNGKTPLQAVKLKTYRPKVIELLKQFEQGDARESKQSGLAPFDLGFVWERLGLERP